MAAPVTDLVVVVPVLGRPARVAPLQAQRDYYAALAEAVREPDTEILWPQRED